MSQLTATPPAPVLMGFARLMQGERSDSVSFDSWPEPWQSVGRRVAGANGHRQDVLKECLRHECGDQAETVVRSIFALDPSEKPVEDGPQSGWEEPVRFHRPSLSPFPTEALPAWLRAFVEAEAEATQTPADMAAMMALSVLSLALTRKVVVRVKDGWLEPVNVWTITTMEPANRKSAVVRDLMAPVAEFQREETARCAPLIREAGAQRKILEARRDLREAQAAKARGFEAEQLMKEALSLNEEAAALAVPASPKLWTDDCTPEMMGSLLSEHGGRMAVISAEGNVLELMAGRYSKGRPNFGVFLAGHAGDSYMVDRRGRPSEHVPHAAITIGITVQREVLRGLAEKPGFRGCGLLARFLYSVPESRLGHRKTDPDAVPGAIAAAYHRHALALLQLPFGTDEEGNAAAHVLTLDAGARELVRAFQEVIEPQLAVYGELGAISDWAGKLCGAVARIAGLLHAAELAPRGTPPWAAPVTAATMASAIRIGHYLTAHARAAFGEMGQDPRLEDARFLLGWLERRALSTFRERDVYQALKGSTRFKRVENVRRAIEVLVEHGYTRPKPVEREGPGRKPSPAFDVHPDVWRRE